MLLDVSNWERDFKRQASGTREKFWLINPFSQQEYLFKVPREGTGEHWAEFIASQLGQRLGINVVNATLAIHKNVLGTISPNFVQRSKGEAFSEGGDLLYSFLDNNFDRYSLIQYNFPNVIQTLSSYGLEQNFITIPVFDAIIGNQDRHCDNWGIITTGSEYRLTPIYDNGSSLGFNLQEDKIQQMLKSDDMFKGYISRGRSLIGLPPKKKPKYLDLLSYIDLHFPKEISDVLEKLSNYDQPMVMQIIDSVPTTLMSEIHKEWIVRLLIDRKEWLLKWHERRV